MYTLKGDQSACRFIDREAVMINAETSAYYSLNQTGSFVLRELIVSSRNPVEISRIMESHFGKNSGELEGDIQDAIALLEAEGLILKAGDNAEAKFIEGGDDVDLPEMYEKPILERHGELEQLILSGE